MKKLLNCKKTLWALLALTTIVGSVQAQTSVTLYGVVDSGIVFKTNQTAGTGTANTTAYQSNGDSPSVFGFRGSEDLGGDLRAGFDLQGYLIPGTGEGGQFGGLFGRQANVSLSNSLGTITLGKQLTPALVAYAATDPRGVKETYSGLISWAFTQMPLNGALSTNSVLDIFMANAASVSAKFGDVNLAAAYSFGGVAGSNSTNSVISLGATYASGALTLSAAFESDKNPTTVGPSGTVTEKYSVGAGYAFGDATVKINYMSDKNNTPATGVEAEKYGVAGLGLDYRTSTNNTVTLAYYHSDNSDTSNDTSNTLILSDDYSLSKNTTLYALIGSTKIGRAYTAGSPFGMGLNSGTTSVLQAGIKHAF